MKSECIGTFQEECLRLITQDTIPGVTVLIAELQHSSGLFKTVKQENLQIALFVQLVILKKPLEEDIPVDIVRGSYHEDHPVFGGPVTSYTRMIKRLKCKFRKQLLSDPEPFIDLSKTKCPAEVVSKSKQDVKKLPLAGVQPDKQPGRPVTELLFKKFIFLPVHNIDFKTVLLHERESLVDLPAS